MDAIALGAAIETAKVTPVCLGYGEIETPHDMQTYFVVVEAPALEKIRERIQATCEANGGTTTFQGAHFFPHVTIGFTERDLFEEDGVGKDASSCVARVR
jgi:hypothetical protein